MSGAVGTHVDGAGERRNSREVVLLFCVLTLLVLFSFTAFISRMYHKKIHVLADEWFAAGEERFQAGDANGALTDYQNALVYSPNNTKFQFHLAAALAAGSHYDQARPYLLALLSESPGSVRNAGSARPGQHNDDVYIGLLGKSADELEELRAEEVL